MAVTGERLYGLYAKNIPFDNANTIKKYGQSIKNYDNFLPQKLDIVVFLVNTVVVPATLQL